MAVGIHHADHATTPLSTKLGTKIGRPVVVTQLVQFAHRLKATEFALCQRSQVRFLMLPDFMSSSVSGTGPTQPCAGK
jgi:hypothetical protein